MAWRGEPDEPHTPAQPCECRRSAPRHLPPLYPYPSPLSLAAARRPYPAHSARARRQALSIRDQRQKNHDEMVREKKQFVTRDKKERAIDYTVSEEKSKLLQQKRESVEKKYRSQFAAQAEAEKWDTAPLRRYFG